tara:strand:- start:541 stop:1074 length:534 start_codon:yes stop_codon:yes gene_type:complete
MRDLSKPLAPTFGKTDPPKKKGYTLNRTKAGSRPNTIFKKKARGGYQVQQYCSNEPGKGRVCGTRPSYKIEELPSKINLYNSLNTDTDKGKKRYEESRKKLQEKPKQKNKQSKTTSNKIPIYRPSQKHKGGRVIIGYTFDKNGKKSQDRFDNAKIKSFNKNKLKPEFQNKNNGIIKK